MVTISCLCCSVEFVVLIFSLLGGIVDLDEYEYEDYESEEWSTCTKPMKVIDLNEEDYDSDEWPSRLQATSDKETTQDLLELLSSDHRDFLIRNNGDQVSLSIYFNSLKYHIILQFEFLFFLFSFLILDHR